MRVVDLSHPVRSGMPVFPGDPAVTTEPALDVAADGCAVTALHLGSHSGTHVDAPSHVIPGGATLDQLDLALFTGPALVVDARGHAPGAPIGWSAFEHRSTDLAPGVVVLVHTGWDERWGTASYEQHPHLTAGVAERLLAAGVRTVGVDTLSPDPLHTLAFHRVWLGAGGVIAENLRGLGQLAALDHPHVHLFPLPIDHGDGAPVRAVAIG
ncbi:Kynurenine formamidase [Quadrisphaera granulorum]|uniref:Kynurenine formamidase n=1 Tax=Quadrisphaera granulorum TaxID=317664 RepID=A0A315ZW88_9ACTN|nr:cyclase family protein [Quadrisphaera granulorum]PWJ49896.1 kynurenine formamidase [Quadrisphaera granulorum]SZE98104.1 Kynurenine formamidase [Quadrisphaera granulorum]